MEKNKAIFAAVFAVVGIFLTLFGLRLFKVTLFIITAIAVFFILAFLLYQTVGLKTAAWIPWALFVVCLIVSIAAGYFTVKLEKVGFFALGAVLAVVGFMLLYTSVISSFKALEDVWLYVCYAVSGIIGGILGIYIYKNILIIATSVIGSFLIVFAAAQFIGKIKIKIIFICNLEV